MYEDLQKIENVIVQVAQIFEEEAELHQKQQHIVEPLAGLTVKCVGSEVYYESAQK